ncbi:MAG: DnaB-like helicase C-terminal domain-containing protein [Patescibacteria group bacterium]
MDLSNSVNYEYFHIDIQWLYIAIMDYFNNPKFKELPTLSIISEYLEKKYSQESFIKAGKELFENILALETNESEFKWYLEKLKTRFNDQVQRSCVSNAIKLIRDGENDDNRIEKVNQIIKDAVVTIDSINKSKTYQEGSLDASARTRLQKYKEIEANPETARGIYSGFSELDRITNGMHPGELLIIGGATSSGKSVVMMNMAINAYLGKQNPMEMPPDELVKGHNVLFFTLEMPKDGLERRIDSCLAQVLYREIRDGKLSSEDKEKYFKALRFQAKYNKKFHIIDMPRGITVREIELKYLEMKASTGINFDIVVVDYIGIMKSSSEQTSDWLALGNIAEELHEFARVYQIPVITATQVNRPKDPSKQQYSTDRVARSDMIPQNANIILQIGNRGDDEYTRLDMPIYITKMRDGEKGSFTLMKDFAKMRVVDMVDATFTEETGGDNELM